MPKFKAGESVIYTPSGEVVRISVVTSANEYCVKDSHGSLFVALETDLAPLAIDNSTDEPTIRTFSSGATRDTDVGKFDYEGFLSPIVLEAFAAYMHFNRTQSDGSLRASDNWQKGIPIEAYRSSLLRHVIEAWKLWRFHVDLSTAEPLLFALCAILFNTQGMIHEILRANPDAMVGAVKLMERKRLASFPVKKETSK